MSLRFLRIKCAQCACLLRVSAEHAGKRVRCPDHECGGVTRLPSHEALNELGLSEAPPSIPPEVTDAPVEAATADA